MTKGELLRILAPFTDSIEIEIETNYGECGGTIHGARYEMRSDGAVLVLCDASSDEQATLEQANA